MLEYFKEALKDILLLRIVFVLWSIPFILIALSITYKILQTNELKLLILLPIVLLSLGCFLLYIGTQKNRKIIDKYIDLIGDGGELIGAILILVVIIIALPIRQIIRNTIK